MEDVQNLSPQKREEGGGGILRAFEFYPSSRILCPSQRREGSCINKSLLALSTVIEKLSQAAEKKIAPTLAPRPTGAAAF